MEKQNRKVNTLTIFSRSIGILLLAACTVAGILVMVLSPHPGLYGIALTVCAGVYAIVLGFAAVGVSWHIGKILNT